MSLRVWVWLVVMLPHLLSSIDAAVVFDVGTTWRWQKGTTEASSPDPTAWRRLDFNDSQWSLDAAPFFYGEPLSGTELGDMRGGYTCVYFRKPFTLVDPTAYSAVRLRVLSDDGFVAWINGQPVARFNVPDGEIDHTGTALGTFTEPLPTEVYEIPNFRDLLIPGENVIAIQGFNASISGSSDFVLEVALEADLDDVAPVVASALPIQDSRVRALTQITVIFNEAVTGVDAGDLRINGSSATNVTGFGPNQFVFEFAAAPAGPVTVQWAADSGIRDRSPRANLFAGGGWRYTVDPNLPQPGVLISEFMADNDRTLNDEDGDAVDWIEIANTSAESADLTGWALTDSATDLMRWRFPAAAIPARGYLVIFASGKNRTDPTGRLHTNFRLSREGGFVALTRPDGSMASQFGPSYPEQLKDISYGRLATDPLKSGYFPTPTPGAPNAEGGPGFAADVRFSRLGGTFSGPFQLTLSAADPGATIHYTTDGSVPTESSPAYLGALSINQSTAVRARSFVSGLLPGRVGAEYYVMLTPAAQAVTSTLPIVLIHSFGAGEVPPDGEYPAFISMYEPRGGVTSMTNSPDLRTRSRLNIRGSSTLYQPKANYSVEFRDERDADRDLSPLGLPADSDWALYAPNNFEPILIHNAFIFELSNEIGRYAPRTRFVEVYVVTGPGPVNNQNYFGIYVLMEKVKVGADRVDLDKLEAEHVDAPQVTGGYLLKIDRIDPGDNGLSAGGQLVAFVDPKEVEVEVPQRAPQRNYIRNYLNAFRAALDSADFRDPVRGWRPYVDQDSWIDHHLLNVLAFNVDALRLSAFFYKEREGKLGFGPIWDFDRSLNSTDGRDANARVWRSQVSDRGTDFFNYPWWGRLFQDPDFWQRWIDRYQELRTDLFSTNHLFALVDQLTDQLRPAQPREAARWPGFTTPRGSYQNEITSLKNWLTRRLNFMDTNFLAAPVFSRPPGTIPTGATLTLSGPAGATLLYTLDGSDPRAAGGEVGGAAKTYISPIALGPATLVRARARDASHRNLTGPDNPPISSPWSGLAEARFSTTPPPDPGVLLITEIQYRPAAPSAAELAANPLWSRSDFEFLELANRGSQPVDLSELRFTQGIAFSFKTSAIPILNPGDHILLVRNRAAFSKRYGVLNGIAGEYQGTLASGGEGLKVEDRGGHAIVDIKFADAWYPTTDGAGFSLVLREESPESATARDSSRWRPSGASGGSPGTADGAAPSLPLVVVNEALTHTDPPQLDGVELRNLEASPADIGGWFLSDDRHEPFKFRVPAGTVLPGGGFLWLDETVLSATPNSTASFRLDSTGDAIWIFAADAAGRLLGYAHGFDFGAAPNGVSFGREMACDGRELFLAQQAVTPGAPNSGPRPPQVVISEIHYRPPDILPGQNPINDTALEFVEIANLSDLQKPLFDPGHATNTWRLKDAVSYTFPRGAILPPRGTALVVHFDPDSDLPALTRFRMAYGVPPSAPIYGPYSGSLPNSRGRIELVRPDNPQIPPDPDPGLVPYFVEDAVSYGDDGVWTPAADGTGRSLQRLEFSGFGDQPKAWVAMAPTPGWLPSANSDFDGDHMDDAWEIHHCLSASDPADASQDQDGDGATARAEYVARTDPWNSEDVLRWTSVRQSSERVDLQFGAKAGVRYQAEVSGNLEADAWRWLTDIPAVANDQLTTVTDPGPGTGNRFYRVVALTGAGEP